MWLYLNEKLIKDENNYISPSNRGFLLGDSVFTTIKVNQGKIEHQEAHFNRLLFQADFFHLNYTIANLSDKILTLIEKNNLQNEQARVRVTLSREGRSEGLVLSKEDKTIELITATPYQKPLKSWRCCVSSLMRPIHPLSHIKHNGYQLSVLAKYEAQQKGFDEAIFLNEKGHFVCTTVSNIFFIIGNKLYTPPLKDGCLPGVIRNFILSQYEVYEDSLTVKELPYIEAAFITNSLMKAHEILEIEGKTLLRMHPIYQEITQLLA